MIRRPPALDAHESIWARSPEAQKLMQQYAELPENRLYCTVVSQALADRIEQPKDGKGAQ